MRGYSFSMKKCKACEKVNLQNANFCMSCGASLAAPEPAFSDSDMSKALIKLISEEYLTQWDPAGEILYISPRNNPDSIAAATRSTRSPSALSITAPIGVFHSSFSKEWEIDKDSFNPAELSVLYDFYSDYYALSPAKASSFSSDVLSEDHIYYIALANQMILDGAAISAYDGSNPKAIYEAVAIIRKAQERKPKKERFEFEGLTGVKKWAMERSWFTSGASTVFAGVPGSSNKGKRFPTLGLIPLNEGWSPLLLRYTFNFTPIEVSTTAVLRSIFEIRDVWMPSYAKVTESCKGQFAPFTNLPAAEPMIES